jgi:hypothetical protein
LAAAADALSVGRDLLGTHVVPGQDGIYAGRSSWARLICGTVVTSALRADMARWAAGVASWVDWLTAQAPDYARADLAAAGRWLMAARALMPPGGEAVTEVAMGGQLLRDVPLASPPERRVPAGNESPAELCAGITISADHLRAITSALSRQDSSITSATGPSWFYAARAAAIVSDLAIRELGTLAEHAPYPGPPGVSGRSLREAADSFAGPCAAWRMASQLWRYVTTGLQRPASAVTGDLDDLVLRMGRLASGCPAGMACAGLEMITAFGERGRHPATCHRGRGRAQATPAQGHHPP